MTIRSRWIQMNLLFYWNLRVLTFDALIVTITFFKNCLALSRIINWFNCIQKWAECISCYQTSWSVKLAKSKNKKNKWNYCAIFSYFIEQGESTQAMSLCMLITKLWIHESKQRHFLFNQNKYFIRFRHDRLSFIIFNSIKVYS